MSSSPRTDRPLQGQLFSVPDDPHEDGRRRGTRRPGRPGRADRMAARLDRAARAAEREAAACRRTGDDMGSRRAMDEATGARRAAAMLRGGPESVESFLDAS